MTRKQSAKRLSNALYSVSEQNNVLEPVHRSLIMVNELVKTESEFRAFVQSKRIKGKAKVTILNAVMGDAGHPLVGEILSHLQGRKATAILQDVTYLFNRRFKEGKNIVSVKGTVASEMSAEERSSLKTSLDQILGKNTDLSIDVDEAVIGGIRLRIENTFLDATVQNQLQTLRTEMLQS
jgi:F-type H+-transporting ATPase subunit delta